MHKLCTLKEMVPGSVVELPEKYQAKQGENDLVLGLEYATDGKRIRADLLRETGLGMTPMSLPYQKDDTEMMLKKDDELQKAATKAFISHKMALPALGMSVGCDPEVFVLHEDGTVFPAWEFMPCEDDARKIAKGWMATKFDYNNHIGAYKRSGR